MSFWRVLLGVILLSLLFARPIAGGAANPEIAAAPAEGCA